MFCSISSEAPQEPVLSTKSGRIFDKHNLEKWMEANGNIDPISNEPLNPEEIIPIKGEKTLRPRPATATSIPGLLHMFQNEWDAVMLECFTLKQQLESVRQELSHALYQHDAACRVIARLIKERDESRNMLAQLRANPGLQQASGTEKMDIEAPRVPPEAEAKITAKAAELSSERKKRVISAGLATAEEIASYTAATSNNLHKTTEPGILCLDIHPNQDKIVTGGVDSNVIIFDRSSKKISATLTGHNKRVVDVLFHPTKNLLFSASSDKTAKIWTASDSSYSCTYTVKEHTGEVSGIDLHPTGDYLVTGTLDSSWAFHDIALSKMLTQVNTPSGVSALAVHPDGVLVGTGLQSSVVSMWDMKASKNVANFEGHSGAIVDLHFSENGYFLATASQDNTVKLWDLRKLKDIQTVSLPSDYQLSSVCFDFSGTYLAVAGSDIRIFTAKTMGQIGNPFTKHNAEVTDVKFGKDAQWFASVSLDRSLKSWSKKK